MACSDPFQYNPNQVILDKNQQDLNAKNIARIQKRIPSDTVRFILMGDSQRFYDELADFVESANQQRDISFVLHAGDISDFGLTQEFKWVHEIMQDLRVPYLTVLGNHDLIANASTAYRKMYGDFNYSFEFGTNKFIFINTNSREFNFDGTVPDLPWLKQELANNPLQNNAFVIAHIPPFDADFDPKLEKEYAEILAADPHVNLTLYGHQHTFRNGTFYNDGVEYYLTTSMQDRGYLLITTWKGGYLVDRIKF
ncbi:metallophosphoesterase [Arundinibacter roseus]|uniref:Metallophosphoesterase n=2 Tax=Arundinibacter roseus TaxID=2070510 RepID=A0A4R4JYQ1_9BACT|nr:metallophosphoesterase [Arundinibacter roseus]